MELKLLYGIGNFTFGMKESDIIGMIGNPDKIFVDEDDKTELFYQYNRLKLKLTFYTEHDGKLGYIRTSNRHLTYQGNPIIALPIDKVKKEVFGNLPLKWEVEEHDFFTVHFNEDYWLVLNSEYDEITDVELGVPFNDNDEYDWK